MISLSFFNVFEGFSKSVLSASQFEKKIEKSAYSFFFKELDPPGSLKKHKITRIYSYVSILLGSASVISAVAAFFYCQKVGIPVDQMANKVLSKEDCDSLLSASNGTVEFIDENFNSIFFCQNTYG